MKYPKKRKPTGTIECEICGKIIPKRGYRGHLWLKHGLKEGISDSLKSKMAINRHLNKVAESLLEQDITEIRIESLRNVQATIGIVDDYSTDKFRFQKINDKFFSIRRLHAHDD